MPGPLPASAFSLCLSGCIAGSHDRRDHDGRRGPKMPNELRSDRRAARRRTVEITERTPSGCRRFACRGFAQASRLHPESAEQTRCVCLSRITERTRRDLIEARRGVGRAAASGTNLGALVANSAATSTVNMYTSELRRRTKINPQDYQRRVRCGECRIGGKSAGVRWVADEAAQFSVDGAVRQGCKVVAVVG